MLAGHDRSTFSTRTFARLTSPLVRTLSNLCVGRKLLLIYLLDLSTVIFISSILIHEKYIAIDFSRKEISGTAYIAELRPTLVALGRSAPAADVGESVTTRLADAERQHGAGMGSAELNQRLLGGLQQMRDAGPAASARGARPSRPGRR